MCSDKYPSSEVQELVERYQAILTGNWKTSVLSVAAELRIADLLATGPRTGAALASATGAHPSSAHRLLRALSTIGICAEREDGSFELTPLGSLLQEESPYSQRAWTIWWGRHLWPVWGNLLYSVTTGESARKLASGTDGFEHLERDPQAAAVFNDAMVELTRLIASELLPAYDFSSMRRVVDIGGGHGALLAAVLEAHAGLRGTVYDLPHAIDGARAYLTRIGLLARCDLVTGDFFAKVPSGADAYLLKNIIHDWDDDRSTLILGNCRRAMPPSGRLILVERIMPDRLDATSWNHRAVAWADLTMMLGTGGCQRTEGEFRTLLASSGLVLSRIIPTSMEYSVLEAVPG